MLLGNLTYSDIDPGDVADLTVTMAPEWDDLFELTTAGGLKLCSLNDVVCLNLFQKNRLLLNIYY